MAKYVKIPSPKWNTTERRWVLQITHKGQRKVFTSKTPKTAGRAICIEKCQAWLATFENENINITFAVAWDRFLTEYENRHGSIEQLRKYKTLGRLYLVPYIGARAVSSLTIEDYQGLINNARPQRRRGKNGDYLITPQLSKKYLKAIRDAILAFNKWARPRKYTDLDLASELYVPASAPVKGREILQIEEIKKIFANDLGLWYENALKFELLTGLRPGEVLGLMVSDFSAAQGVIVINRSINARGIVTPGKNKNARRAICLPPVCCDLLLKQIAVARSLKSNYIFCNPLGAPGSQEAMCKCWRRICKQLGINSNTTPYCLRHTFYSHTEAYMPERLIKMVFGHSEKTDGHAIYGDHVINGELKAAADMLTVTPIYRAAADS